MGKRKWWLISRRYGITSIHPTAQGSHRSTLAPTGALVKPPLELLPPPRPEHCNGRWQPDRPELPCSHVRDMFSSRNMRLVSTRTLRVEKVWHIGVLAAIGFLIFLCVCWPTGSSVTVDPVYFLSIGDFGSGSENQKLVAQQVEQRISYYN